MYMMRTTASRFKTQLGTFMRAVRGGQEVVVTDRDEPVAKLVPFKPTDDAALVFVRRAGTDETLAGVKLSKRTYEGIDSVALLRADRDRS